MPSVRARRAASRSQTLSPTTTACSTGQPSCLTASKNRSGSGLAWGTRSRVTIGTPSGTPSIAIAGPALSIRPLVAIAQAHPSSERRASSRRAPGSGRTSPIRAL